MLILIVAAEDHHLRHAHQSGDPNLAFTRTDLCLIIHVAAEEIVATWRKIMCARQIWALETDGFGASVLSHTSYIPPNKLVWSVMHALLSAGGVVVVVVVGGAGGGGGAGGDAEGDPPGRPGVLPVHKPHDTGHPSFVPQ